MPLPSPSLALLIATLSVTLYLAAHHAALAVRLEGAKQHRWLALFLVASLVLGAARFVHYTTDSAATAALALRAQWSLVWLLQATLVALCRQLVGAARLPWLVPSLFAGSAVVGALSLATPWAATDQAHLWVDALGQRYFWVELGPLATLIAAPTLPLLAYCLGLVWRAPTIDHPSRLLISTGFTLYVLVGVNDFMIGVLHTRGVVLFEHGFFLLAVALDTLVVRRTRALYRDLEGEVDRRTAQLRDARDRLEVALDQANQAARTRSQFVANMSHEIRTPLNGVLGLLDVLSRTRLDERQQTFVNNMKGSGKALMHVVDQVLDFSKLESSRFELAPRPTDVAVRIEDLVQRMAQRAQARGTELVAVLSADLPDAVSLDADRLDQVLTNLLGNAIKFTQNGRIVVSASLAHKRLRVDVTDSGVGIRADALATIFDPFVQVDASLRRKAGGTGLGLAISKNLVELMGGSLHVESTPGVGSTFWFELPCDAPPSPPRPGAQVAVTLVCKPGPLRDALSSQLAALGVAAKVIEPDAATRALAEPPSGRELWLVDPSTGFHPDIAPDREIVSLRRLTEAPPSAPTLSLFVPTTRAALRDLLETRSVPAGRRSSSDPLLVGRDSTPTPTSARGPRVLVAEDNNVNQLVVRHMLRQLGYVATIVDNGQAALDALDELGDIKAVLMDCQMPVLDGYEATRQLREREVKRGLERLPVIAVTAHAIAEEREKARVAGVDDYLTKPLQIDALRASLDRLVRRSAS